MFIDEPDFIDLGPDSEPWLDENGNPVLEIDEEDVTRILIETWRTSGPLGLLVTSFGRISYDTVSDRLFSHWSLDDPIEPTVSIDHIRPMSFSRPAW